MDEEEETPQPSALHWAVSLTLDELHAIAQLLDTRIAPSAPEATAHQKVLAVIGMARRG